MAVRAALLTAVTAVTAVTALAAAVLAADENLTNPRQKHIMIVYKAVADTELNYDVGEFFIPPGQCSGVLDQLLKCEDGQDPLGVWVSVEEWSPFPRVKLEDSLRSASVVRAAPCNGESQVSVKLACLPQRR